MKKTPLELTQELNKDVKDFEKILGKYNDQQEKAQKWFSKQVGYIQSIRTTEGYKEIRNYWISKLSAAQSLVMNAANRSQEDYAKYSYGAAIEMNMAYQFISFLDNLANYEAIQVKE